MWEQELLYQGKKNPDLNGSNQNKVDETHGYYQQAVKKVEEEMLVAGEAFNMPISLFKTIVNLHVMLRYQDVNDRPDWLLVLSQLDSATKRAVKDIDDISQ